MPHRSQPDSSHLVQPGHPAPRTAESAAAPSDQTVEALLVNQARHDPDAFGRLYERYVDKIYAYIFHRVGSPQDAEDLTARTFYKALEKLDSYEDRGLPFSAWLYRIAHNLTANWHRDHSRRRSLPLDGLTLTSAHKETPEASLEATERSTALWEAIDRLPGDRRDLLLYKFGNRFSNLEIGKLLGRSEGAIKSLYFRTLAVLREDLESRGWEEDEE